MLDKKVTPCAYALNAKISRGRDFVFLHSRSKHQTSLELENCPILLLCFCSPPNTTITSEVAPLPFTLEIG